MALKVLLMRKERDTLNRELDGLKATRDGFEARESELAEAINELAPDASEEDKAAVDEAVEAFEKEKAETYVSPVPAHTTEISPAPSVCTEKAFSRDLSAPVETKTEKEDEQKETFSRLPEEKTEPYRPAELKKEAPPAPIIRSFEETRSYRIIGEAFNSYVIVERGEKIILIDKHAAHERIIFERMRANMKNKSIPSQILLMPLTVMLRSDEIAILEEYRQEIEAVGFGFKMGRHVLEILEVPEGIDVFSSPDILSEFADKLLNATGTVDLTRDLIFEKALYQASCKAAIKAGREYSFENIEALIAELMSIEDITVCPHGRPVAMELSKKNIDRQFSRT